MPAVKDFRSYAAFDVARLDASGKDVGKKVYWKLYAMENLLRVIVHSVLHTQVGKNWWTQVVDPSTTQKSVAKRMKDYATLPWYSLPGNHEIYYTYLPELGKIVASNSNQFKPMIPDIDQWVAKIEQIRPPRNVVGHMNWLTPTDRSRVDVFYADLQRLAQHLGKELAARGASLLIP